MKETSKMFLNKRCVLKTFSNSVIGIIKEVNDTAILVEDGAIKEIINMEYIVSIREYPLKEKKK